MAGVDDTMTDDDREVEIGREIDTDEDVYLNCEKNPEHNGFVPLPELSLHRLPPEWRHQAVLDFIKYRGKTVVRLVVTRLDGETIYGSGYASKFEGQYVISTNNHVIRNDREAKRCLIEFNYDSADRSNVIECEGTGLLETSEVLDKTLISFLPIPRELHDLGLVEESLFSPEVRAVNFSGEEERCQALTMPYKVGNSALLAMPRRFDINNKADISIPFFDGTNAKLASIYVKFEPVPNELYDPTQWSAFSRATVTLAENEQGQVGTITQVADQIVLELQEPVTKDEACRCHITFVNGFVSRGTNVYFKTNSLMDANTRGLDMNVEQMLRTGDLNIGELLKIASQPFWFVNFKPIPPGVLNHLNLREVLGNMSAMKTAVVIGHPHGWPKMVTIGKDIAFNLDRVNSEYRCSVAYSAPTCPGSSGSPVLYLNSWRSYIHYGGKRMERYQDQIVETRNVNKAWWWRKYLNSFID